MDIKRKIQQVFFHQGLVKYAKNTSWLLAEKILRIFFGLLVGVWVARYLGAIQFGVFNYVQSFVFLFSAIATLGLDSIVVRELVQNHTKTNQLMGTAFVLKLIGSMAMLLFVWIGASIMIDDGDTVLLMLIVASATLFQSLNVIDYYYQSLVMSKYVALANTFVLLCSGLAKIVLILCQADLTAFLMIVVLDAIMLACGLLYFYVCQQKKSLWQWQFDKKIAGQLLKDAYPLMFSGMMIALYMRIDQIMIHEMLGSSAVGQYSAALRLSEAWYFVPMTICASLFPAILNAKQISAKMYQQRMEKLYALMIWVGMLVGMVMWFFGDSIIDLLYGSEYAQASSVLALHIWSGIFVGLGVASSMWISAENLTSISFQRTFVGVIVNILLNLILIERYGIVGAGMATLVAQASVAWLYDIFDKRTRHQFFLKTFSFIKVPYLYVKNG